MASPALQRRIRNAVEGGAVSLKYAGRNNHGRYLQSGGSRIRLMAADGEATAAGRYFYGTLQGLPIPALYAYESPLIHDKYVQGFDGSMVLVRRKNAEGIWEPTAAGRNYFKYARDEIEVQVPVVTPRPDGKIPAWWGRYGTLPDPFTVGYLRSPPNQAAYRRLATQAQQDAFVRQAVQRWLQEYGTRTIVDGQERLIVLLDSKPWILADGPWLLNRRRTMFRDNGRPTTETILNRPLQGRVVLDGCWRPWDLDPSCLASTGDCAIRMLEACHVKWLMPSRAARRGGNTARVPVPVFQRSQIEAELDKIFAEIHAEGEFPFERGWREEGVTSAMLLRYAEVHGLKAFVHHRERMVARYIPEGADGRTPILNWAISGDHCLFYAGRDANNAAAQTEVREVREKLRSGEMDIAEFHEECDFHYADKSRAPCFREPSKLPPFEEWKSGHALLTHLEEPAEERPKKKARRGETPTVYYAQGGEEFGSVLRDLERYQLKHAGTARAISVQHLYGGDATAPIAARVVADGVPPMLLKSVCRDAETRLDKLYRFVRERFKVPRGCFEYYGQSAGQAFEELRIFLAKRRRAWTLEERERVREASGDCALCGATLEAFELDHIKPLCDGVADEFSNLEALCLVCQLQL